MKTFFHAIKYVIMAAFLFCGSQAVIAQEDGMPVSAKDPLAILKRMTDFMGSHDQFELIADIYDDELTDVENEDYILNQQSMISVKQPDRFRIDMFIDDKPHRNVIYNGSTLTLFDHNENLYTVIDVAETIDKTLDIVLGELDIAAPLTDFIYNNVDESFLQDIVSSDYIGEETVNDHLCHHLKFVQDSIDWHIWIETGEQPYPRKLMIQYKEKEGAPEYIAEFVKWEFGIEFNTDEFEFWVQEGAEQIDYIASADELSEGDE